MTAAILAIVWAVIAVANQIVGAEDFRVFFANGASLFFAGVSLTQTAIKRAVRELKKEPR